MSKSAELLRTDNAREAAVEFSLFDLPEGYFDAPHQWFRLLRDHDPVHRNHDGSVLLTRYDDVRTVWGDPSSSVDKTEMFRQKFGEGPLLQHHTTGMLFRDPPDHDRLRAAVKPLFTNKSVKRLRTFIEEHVEALLDEAEERREIDFVTDFASRIPIHMICKILGVPPEDGQYLRELGAKILFPLNPNVAQQVIDTGHATTTEFMDYLAPYVEEERRNGANREGITIIGAMVATESAGEQISEAEIMHMCILMLNGGHETTTNLISVSTNSLLDQPEQYREMAEHGDELGFHAIEECIRFVSPLQLQGRRTTRDVQIPSGELPEGTEVILCQASANRDDRAFENPDLLDLRRRPNAHVAFGLGVHVCIGRPLARLEAGIVLPRVAKRLPKLQRTGEPVFNRNARFRGLMSLPVRTR